MESRMRGNAPVRFGERDGEDRMKRFAYGVSVPTLLSRLKRMLFGPGADKRTAVAIAAPTSNTSSKDAPPAGDEPSEPTTPLATPTEERARRRGHGRQSAAAYTGTRRVVCADPELMPGDCCPARPCQGHLYDTREPSLFIRLEGRPVITATQARAASVALFGVRRALYGTVAGGRVGTEVRPDG